MAELFVVDVLDTIEKINGSMVDIVLWSDGVVRMSAPYQDCVAQPVDAEYDASIPF